MNQTTFLFRDSTQEKKQAASHTIELIPDFGSTLNFFRNAAPNILARKSSFSKFSGSAFGSKHVTFKEGLTL
jgi:hypothetical protein